MYLADVSTTTRERTPEGMLRATAVLTRAGRFPYDALEIGVGLPGQTIMVDRPRAVVDNPDTLASIRGAAVTLDHPPMDVKPDNWRDLVVGNVVGEPRVDSQGMVVADILIGRQDAIQAIESGTHELSIGYDFSMTPAPAGSGADMLTTGHLHVNHVAIVQRGRAGSQVRILDSAGNNGNSAGTIFQIGEQAVSQDALTAAVTAAVAAGIRDQAPKGADSAAMTAAITAALGPVVESVKSVADEQRRSKAATDAAAAEAEAKKAADALTEDTWKQAHAYYQTVNDAMPLIPEEQRAGLAGKPAKDIMAAALTPIFGAQVAAMDEGTMRGALMMAKHQADAAGGSTFMPGFTPPANTNGGFQPTGGWPAGIGGGRPAHGLDASTSARDAYIKRMTDAFKKKGPMSEEDEDDEGMGMRKKGVM